MAVHVVLPTLIWQSNHIWRSL